MARCAIVFAVCWHTHALAATAAPSAELLLYLAEFGDGNGPPEDPEAWRDGSSAHAEYNSPSNADSASEIEVKASPAPPSEPDDHEHEID